MSGGHAGNVYSCKFGLCVCPSATTVLKTNSCQEVIVVEADRVRYTLALKIAQTISDLISAVAMQSGELMPACMLTLEMRSLN
jgi:hypothetical protein